MKSQSPLLGFNNNVKHKGRVFHIQTEDSGVRHPHVITHLFADGGRILKTTKTSYAEHVGNDTMAETVTAMMKEQHKAMFIALRDGQFDHMLDGGGAPAAAAARRELAVAATIPRMATPQEIRPGAPAEVGEAVAAIAVEAEAPPPSRRPSRPKLEVDATQALLAPATRSTSPTAMTATMPTAVAEPSLDLDLDALERAAAEAQTPFFQKVQDLPPPPAAVLGKKPPATATTFGNYRAVTPEPPVGRHAPTPTQGTSINRAHPPAPPPEHAQPSATAGRYAASRPAAIFANTRPTEGASIFGEELISEKSLDEVILSYLAEDLEPPPKK